MWADSTEAYLVFIMGLSDYCFFMRIVSLDCVLLIVYLFSCVQIRTRMIEMVSKGLATLEVLGFRNSFP